MRLDGGEVGSLPNKHGYACSDIATVVIPRRSIASWSSVERNRSGKDDKRHSRKCT